MATTTLIWLLPLPPLVAFALIVLFTNRSKALSHTVAVGAAFLSWLGSMVVFVRALVQTVPGCAGTRRSATVVDCRRRTCRTDYGVQHHLG